MMNLRYKLRFSAAFMAALATSKSVASAVQQGATASGGGLSAFGHMEQRWGEPRPFGTAVRCQF